MDGGHRAGWLHGPELAPSGGNVVVQQHQSGRVEVAAVDPVASMQAIDNIALRRAAEQVREKLGRVIDSLGSSQANG